MEGLFERKTQERGLRLELRGLAVEVNFGLSHVNHIGRNFHIVNFLALLVGALPVDVVQNVTGQSHLADQDAVLVNPPFGAGHFEVAGAFFARQRLFSLRRDGLAAGAAALE